MAGPRAKEFMKKFQAQLAEARTIATPAPATPPASPVHDHETNHGHETRHDELIRRHTPPLNDAPALSMPGVDPIFVERLRERVMRAAEREARRLAREQERDERRRERERERTERDTSESFATGRKVEID